MYRMIHQIIEGKLRVFRIEENLQMVQGQL